MSRRTNASLLDHTADSEPFDARGCRNVIIALAMFWGFIGAVVMGLWMGGV